MNERDACVGTVTVMVLPARAHLDWLIAGWHHVGAGGAGCYFAGALFVFSPYAVLATAQGDDAHVGRVGRGHGVVQPGLLRLGMSGQQQAASESAEGPAVVGGVRGQSELRFLCGAKGKGRRFTGGGVHLEVMDFGSVARTVSHAGQAKPVGRHSGFVVHPAQHAGAARPSFCLRRRTSADRTGPPE